MLQPLEQGSDRIPVLKAVDVNLHFVLFDLDLSLDALDEMLVDGLQFHCRKRFWEIFSEVINQVK